MTDWDTVAGGAATMSVLAAYIADLANAGNAVAIGSGVATGCAISIFSGYSAGCAVSLFTARGAGNALQR